MKALAAVLTLAAMMLTGCSKDEPAAQARPIAPKPASATAPVAPAPPGGTAPTTAQDPNAITMETAGLDMALQRFVKAKGRLPASVQEMVTEKMLPAIPPAPAGKKFAIDAQAKRVVVVAQ